MNRNQFRFLVVRAADVGPEQAWDEWLTAQDEINRANFDGLQQQRDECPDDLYQPGCGPDDTRDHKGRPLRSRFNEAGEPRW